MIVRCVMTWLFGCALLCLPAPAQTSSRGLAIESDAGRRVALVIGNSSYPGAQLQNTRSDARAMAEVLREIGFEVDSGEDLDGISFDRAVAAFLAKVRRGDVALFYFSGHGFELNHENYLVPVDFRAKDEFEAKRSAYSANLLLEKLEARQAGLTIIVLDACRNNPFRGIRAGGGGLGAMEVGGAAAVFISFATGAGRVASDNPRGTNGLFTGRLVESLRKPCLTLHEIFDEVGEEVKRDSGGEQVPWTANSPIPTFVFRKEGGCANPTFGEQMRNTISELERAGRYAETIPLLDTYILANPKDIRAYVDRSNARLRTGDIRGSIKDSNTAVTMEPGNAMAYNNRGVAYMALSDYGKAISDLSKALELEPGSWLSYRDRGKAYARVGDRDRALRDLEDSIRLRRTAEAYYEKGVVFMTGKDFASAKASFDSAIELDRAHAGSYLNRGMALMQLRNYDGAIQDFNRAESLDVATPGLYSERGLAYAKLGKSDQALGDYGRALQMNPNSAPVLNNRGWLYVQIGRCREAMPDLNRSISLNATAAATWDSRGVAHFCLKEYPMALQDLDRSLSLRPNDPVAHGHRADVKQAMGDRTGAAADRAAAAGRPFTPPVITSFTIEPASIRAGQSAVLSWSALNAPSVSIDQGIGVVAPSGNRRVFPPVSITYTITAGSGGAVESRSVRLDVSSSGVATGERNLLPTPRVSVDQPIRQPMPLYSDPDAIRKGIQGTVTMLALVDSTGHVTDVRLLEGVHPALDEQAISAVRNWIWPAGTLPGERPVSIRFGSTQLIPRIQVGAAEQRKKLVYEKKPEYPHGVRRSSTGAQVRFEILIGIDGRVTRVLRVLEGKQEYVVAAVTAIGKCRYSPTFRDNVPVEVVTEAVVEF